MHKNEQKGGVAGAIESKCGRQVQVDCENYLKKIGLHEIPVSQVIHTKAYNIHATHILHAVGPRWYDYSESKKESCFIDLKNTFYNCFIYADKQQSKLNEAKSIAIPLISSGIYSVPKDVCCKALFEAINEYLNGSDKTKLKLIVLINLDESTNDHLYRYFVDQLKSSKNSNKAEINNNKNDEINLNICCACKQTNDLNKLKCGCYHCSKCVDPYDADYECKNENCSQKMITVSLYLQFRSLTF